MGIWPLSHPTLVTPRNSTLNTKPSRRGGPLFDVHGQGRPAIAEQEKCKGGIEVVAVGDGVARNATANLIRSIPPSVLP